MCGFNLYLGRTLYGRDNAPWGELVQSEILLQRGFRRAPEGSVRSAEGDQRFDEIGAELLIKKYQREKADLMSRLAVFYRIRILKWDAARALEGLDIDLEGPDEA